MGRSVSFTYRIEFQARDAYLTSQGWYPEYGRATDANLAKHIHSMEKSTQPGGANAHLGPMNIRSAKVIRQSTGEVVATYKQPLFEVVE